MTQSDDAMRAAAREYHRERQGQRRPVLSQSALAAIGAGQNGAGHILLRPPHGPSPFVPDKLSVAPPPPAKVELVNAASVTMTAVRWLWNGYLARGKFHVLGGPPGCGKTTIVLALAASITTRGRFPDGSPCGAGGNVVIWSGEDDLSDTLAPRLAAAGADMRRVFFVGSVREGDKTRSFDPAKDTGLLREAIRDAGGAALLMVDPIVSAVAGDSHKNAEVRRALQPLADLAAEADAALIGITHFSKGTGGRDPTERITGSLAFAALARVVMIAAKVEPKDDEPAKRIFARAKANNGRDDGGFEYDLEQVEVPDHAGMFASVVRWGPAIDGSARDILAEAESVPCVGEGSKTGAESLVRTFLADGPKTVAEIKSAAEAHGYSWRTIERVKHAAPDITAVREGFGAAGRWKWQIVHSPPFPAIESPSQSLAVNGGVCAEDGGQDI